MTYRVEIVDIATQKVVSVIGTGLSRRRAERREMTGLEKINDDYFVRIVEEGKQ